MPGPARVPRSSRAARAAALAGPLVLLLLAAPGCSTLWPRPVVPNPLLVPAADFETVWSTTVAVLDEHFDIASEDRLSGQIKTQPLVAATIVEPWRRDSASYYDRLEASLQTIRRFALATVEPAPGGGYQVKVEVHKELEDLVKPDRAMGGRAVFDNTFPLNRTREVVGPIPLPVGWIRKGRDPGLEQVILNRIRRNLAL